MTLISQRPKNSPTPQKSSEDFFGVQAKLSIGKSNDKYEVEADKMADTIVTKKQTKNSDTFFNPSPIVQRKQANEVQKKEMPNVATTSPIPVTKTEGQIKAESETKNTTTRVAENKATNPVENPNSAPTKQEEKGPENGNAGPNSSANDTTSNSSVAAPNNSTTTQKIPTIEEKKVEEVGTETAKTDEIPAEGKKGEEIVEEPSIERDPNANPAFQSVVAGIGKTAEQQKDNDPAELLSANAQAAAPSPSNERNSQAQANQVDEMEAQEPQVFSADAFKAQLMARIAEMQLPKNNDEADNFEDHNNIDEVNEKATEDVKKEKAAAAGPIDQTTNKQPNTDAVPERTEVPLPPLKEAPKPKSVGATKAIPDKRPDSEVVKPIEEDTARMDQTMTENKVTDEQLEKSQEPTFQEALAKKTEAKTIAQAAPNSLREQENAVLQKNANKAENASQNELEGMNLLRGTALQGVGTTQADSSSKDTSERERIANEINNIYEETKTDVTNILDTLETTVTEKFEAEAEIAKGKFEEYVDQKMALYKSRRYSGIGGGIQWGIDLFAGLPDEVNVFFTEGREVFINHMDGAITVIANIVATELTLAKNRIELGKQKVTDFVNELPTNQKKFGQEAADDIQVKFDSLKDEVNSKQDSLVDSLAQQYSDSIGEVDARIEEMKAANKGLIDAAIGFINGIIETIKKLRDLVSSLLSAIASVIEVIIAAPIEFMGNLFKGIGQGIDLFKANIQKHLLGGLLEWLTGSLGPMGITVPDDIFSLKGIFNLLMQVLGLGWDQIRMKAVKVMGEPVVNALTLGYDMFIAFSTKGIDGIWEYLEKSFGDLKETVIDAIKNMLITQVIEAGIKWLLSLLIPGAGFIKAIMAIKDVIVFFVESAIMLIPAIIEGILALAAGSVAGVAKAIEFGLAKLLPLVIGLFAKLIGLGGLSKKVMKIFTNIRKRIDKVIMKLLMKAKAAGRKLLGKMGLTKPTKEKKGEEVKNDPEKQAKIDAGLADLNKEEKKYLSSNKISREEAVQVAKTIKGRHPVFSSFKVVDGKDSWDYAYKASPEVIVEGEKKEETERPILTEKTAIDYGGGSGKATAFPVTKKVKGNKSRFDIPAAEHAKKLNDAKGEDKKGAKGRKGDWIKGHIITWRMGGNGGSSENIFIIDRSANGNMSTLENNADSKLKQVINKPKDNEVDKVLFYEVNYTYWGSEYPLNGFGKNILISYGTSKMDGSDKDYEVKAKKVDSTEPPLNTEEVNYDLNRVGEGTLRKLLKDKGIKPAFTQNLIRIRSKGGIFNTFGDLDKRLKLEHNSSISLETVKSQIEILKSVTGGNLIFKI